MRPLSIICLCVYIWHAHGQEKSPPSDALVGITFARNDPTHTAPGRAQTFVSYTITKSGIGWSQWTEPGDAKIVIGGAMSGHTRDTNAVEKAAQAIRLLKGLAQPKHLPESPSQVLTASWLEGSKVVERRFPIDQVPSEVRRALLVTRCPERDLKGLRFIRAPATNGIPDDR